MCPFPERVHVGTVPVGPPPRWRPERTDLEGWKSRSAPKSLCFGRPWKGPAAAPPAGLAGRRGGHPGPGPSPREAGPGSKPCSICHKPKDKSELEQHRRRGGQRTMPGPRPEWPKLRRALNGSRQRPSSGCAVPRAHSEAGDDPTLNDVMGPGNSTSSRDGLLGEEREAAPTTPRGQP